MGKFAFVLAVLALGGAGWAVYQVERARTTDDREALDALSLRLAAIERGVAELNARPAPAAPLEAHPAAASTTSPGNAGTTTAPSLSAPGRTKATLEDRLAALEKTLTEPRAGPFPDGQRHELELNHEAGGPFLAMPGFWPDVDSAAKAMKLDDGTKARLENIVEATKRGLDDLYERPNDEGVLWKDVNGDLKLDGTEPGEMMTKVGEHMKKVAKFKNGKVPGTSETYAEAERRIKKEGRDRARSVLDPDQAKVWDRGHPDTMFGGAGGGDGFGAVTFMTSSDDTLPVPAR